MTSPLAQVAANGVSIWLDDLSRTRISSGDLAGLIDSRSVVGVTTNPTIFAQSIGKGEGYEAQVAELAKAGASASEAIFEITTKDVADACDVFAGVYAKSHGFEPVSVEEAVKQAKAAPKPKVVKAAAVAEEAPAAEAVVEKKAPKAKA